MKIIYFILLGWALFFPIGLMAAKTVTAKIIPKLAEIIQIQKRLVAEVSFAKQANSFLDFTLLFMKCILFLQVTLVVSAFGGILFWAASTVIFSK